MKSKVEYLSKLKEPYPDWLNHGRYSLRNFFGSRTVFYPGAGGDGRPLDTFNPSHSSHCYFFVDQWYSVTGLDEHAGPLPTGYSLIFDKQYSADELARESMCPLPEDALEQYSLPPKSPIGSSTRSYRSRDDSMLAAIDSASAVCLRVYERQRGFGDAHGAERFAIFCLGMEARTAYEWFYGTMFRGNPPFAVWLKDHGFGGDFAKRTAGDKGFGDPDGRLYRAARRTGLPEYLVVNHGNKYWRGYRWVEGVEPEPGFYGDRLYEKNRPSGNRPPRSLETLLNDGRQPKTR